MFGWEADVLRWFESLRNEVLVPLFEAVTMLGEETVLVILLAVLYFAVDKVLARRLFFITLTSMSVNGAVKNIVQRPRPFATGVVSGERLETATSFSFPSGHTQCFSTWSTVAALRLRKTWVTVLTAGLITAVAVSRLFLGAHYPTDVLVGAALGIGLGVIGNAVYDRVRSLQMLYVGTVLALLPLAVWFAVAPNAQFDDFFSCYGMLIGFAAAVPFEERLAPIDLSVPVWKKGLRVVLAIGAVLAVKAAFKLLPADGTTWPLLSDGLRSVAMSFTAFGLCPWIFKHLHI